MSAADLEIAYRPAWRPSSASIGAHRSRFASGLGTFRDTVPLMRQPDPRRIDLRQTIKHPRRELQVRRFEQRSAITVCAVVDISGSMAFSGRARKMDNAVALCTGLSRYARRVGDAFGLVACDAHARPEFTLPASRRRGLEEEIMSRLARHRPSGIGGRGLVEAAGLLAGRRKLVFLISDFRMPIADVEAVMEALANHDVVPLVLEDSLESEGLPRWGLVELADLETGRRRLTFLRPALHDALRAESEARRLELGRVFARSARRPFYVRDRLNAEKLAEHLLGGGG